MHGLTGKLVLSHARPGTGSPPQLRSPHDLDDALERRCDVGGGSAPKLIAQVANHWKESWFGFSPSTMNVLIGAKLRRPLRRY